MKKCWARGGRASLAPPLRSATEYCNMKQYHKNQKRKTSRNMYDSLVSLVKLNLYRESNISKVVSMNKSLIFAVGSKFPNQTEYIHFSKWASWIWASQIFVTQIITTQNSPQSDLVHLTRQSDQGKIIWFYGGIVGGPSLLAHTVKFDYLHSIESFHT